MRARLAPTLSLSIALCAGGARAFEWPVVTAPEASRADLVERFRWDHISAWYAPAPDAIRGALDQLDAARDDSARAHGLRAVLHRLLRQDDEARAALERALARSPDRAVLDDPDVALTAAWLAARAGDFNSATSLGVHALARMSPSSPQTVTHREALVLEVARWSMARGASGLDDAVHILRAFVAASPATPMVRATLALALARGGHVDEARALVVPVRETLRPGDGDGERLVRGGVVFGEGPAAAGVALRLVGRARDAVEPLTRASTQVPEAWRAFQALELAAARRGGP